MFSEDTRSEMMVHVLQPAYREGFRYSHWSDGLQIEKGIPGDGVFPPGRLHCMYSILAECPQCLLELF